MVRARITSDHAKINRDKTSDMINKVFGRTLTLRVVTETKDDIGQLSGRSTSDTTFKGDLQFGLDLDQRYLTTGIVEVGDGVLYVHPDAINPLPEPQDIIIDGDSRWEIVAGIEAPELGGTVCHFSYRCKRRPMKDDTKE